MADLLRKKLEKRAETINKKKISPSQRRSDAARKRLRRDAPAEPHLYYDCNGCSKEPCGLTINTCDEKHLTHRCKRCGKVNMYRVNPNHIFEICTECKKADGVFQWV